LVSKSWELSEAGKFVVLPAAEVGPHYPALCLGLPPGGIPVDSADGYQAIDLAQEAGGVAVMCETPGDLRELPVELSNVLGLSGTGSAPVDAWERLLRTGRRFVLFPCTRLEAGELPAKGLPERAMLVGVLAESLTEEAILAALRRGSFYLTTATGPRFTGIEAKGGTVTVRTAEPCQLLFRDETGAVLSGTFGNEAKYRFTGRETYVRAVALADVLEDGFRLEATTQAFYLADELPNSPVGVPEADWTIAEPVDRSGEPEEEEEPEEELPSEEEHAEEAEAQVEAEAGPEAAQAEEIEPTEEAEEEPAGETEDGEGEAEEAEEDGQAEEPEQTEQVEETEETEQTEQVEPTEEAEEVEEAEETEEVEEAAEAQDTEDAGDETEEAPAE
ncbi:MAG: CehA/McbA family metallohydrolase domain-containing protein, partial [Planctomycetota bacterium]